MDTQDTVTRPPMSMHGLAARSGRAGRVLRASVLRASVVLAFIWCLFALPGGDALAHGTTIDAVEVEAVEVAARFDSGEPMTGAQVAVYAPGDEVEPWLTGLTDADGRFLFSPDRSLSGRWAVQVRSAGHGDWVYVDVEDGAVSAIADTGSGFTLAQIAVMSLAVVWGFVGTALYFRRSRSLPGPVDPRGAPPNDPSGDR